MITLAEIEPSAAPAGLVTAVQCAFYIGGFVLCMAGCVRLLKGAPAHPPNESLAISSEEITRRVAALEDQNVEAWKKMEADRIEWKDELRSLAADIGALKRDCELANQRSYQMDGKIDRLLERKPA